MRLTWALPVGLLLFALVPLVLAVRAAAEEARRVTLATRSWLELREGADALRDDVAALAAGARELLARRHDPAG